LVWVPINGWIIGMEIQPAYVHTLSTATPYNHPA
jgi:hypothetical protein